LTGLAALRTLGNQPGPILEARHYLGGFLFAVAVVGLLQLGAGLAAPAGGYLGIAVATLTLRVLGQLGAGLAMFVVGVFAVFLLAGSDLQTFCADIRALFSLLGRGIARIARSVGRAIGVLYAAVAAAIGVVAGAVRRLRQGTGPNTVPAPAASPRGRAASVAPREPIPEPVLDPPIVRLPTPRRVTAVPQGLELRALQEIRDHPRLVPVPVALPPQLAPHADEEDGVLAGGEDRPDLRFAREPDPDLGFEPPGRRGRDRRLGGSRRRCRRRGDRRVRAAGHPRR
jgi:hypothetical protein